MDLPEGESKETDVGECSQLRPSVLEERIDLDEDLLEVAYLDAGWDEQYPSAGKGLGEPEEVRWRGETTGAHEEDAERPGDEVQDRWVVKEPKTVGLFNAGQLMRNESSGEGDRSGSGYLNKEDEGSPEVNEVLDGKVVEEQRRDVMDIAGAKGEGDASGISASLVKVIQKGRTGQASEREEQLWFRAAGLLNPLLADQEPVRTSRSRRTSVVQVASTIVATRTGRRVRGVGSNAEGRQNRVYSWSMAGVSVRTADGVKKERRKAMDVMKGAFRGKMGQGRQWIPGEQKGEVGSIEEVKEKERALGAAEERPVQEEATVQKVRGRVRPQERIETQGKQWGSRHGRRSEWDAEKEAEGDAVDADLLTNDEGEKSKEEYAVSAVALIRSAAQSGDEGIREWAEGADVSQVVAIMQKATAFATFRDRSRWTSRANKGRCVQGEVSLETSPKGALPIDGTGSAAERDRDEKTEEKGRGGAVGSFQEMNVWVAGIGGVMSSPAELRMRSGEQGAMLSPSVVSQQNEDFCDTLPRGSRTNNPLGQDRITLAALPMFRDFCRDFGWSRWGPIAERVLPYDEDSGRKEGQRLGAKPRRETRRGIREGRGDCQPGSPDVGGKHRETQDVV